MNERSLFLAALDISDPTERAAYLARACGGDTALRERIENLLCSHREAGSYLGVPAVAQVRRTASKDRTEALGDASPSHPGTSDPEETQAEPGTAGPAGDEALQFLAPGRKPGSLGRLAHYEVQEILGQGGFGTVLKAFDEKLHRIVAIKILAPTLAASGTARQRFVREARTAAAVRHEHIVVIHAVDEDPLPYLVMECIVGQTLQEKLDRDGPPAVKEVLRIGNQVAAGLAAAHAQGLVHRDIKPANILLENGIERVKITDFGLAKVADDASVTQSGVIAGTPMYMAPEQALGQSVDHRADLFSLGTMLYVMCTGRPPFRAPSTLAVLKRVCEDTPRPVSQINPEIPEWLEAVIVRLMAKKPEDRYQSAQEVADVMADGLADLRGGGRTPRAVPAATRPRPTRSEPRRAFGRRWAIAAGLLALAVLVGGPALYLATRDRDPAPDRTPEAGPEGPPVSPAAVGAQPPPLAVSPFDAKQAKAYQAAWASYLGVDAEVTNSVGMKLRLIPPGEFTMGYSAEQVQSALTQTAERWVQDAIKNTTARPVRVPEPFYLGTTEVTVGQFRRFVEATKYRTTAESSGEGGETFDPELKKYVNRPEYIWSYRFPGMTDDSPVTCVSPEDARAFCAWLTETTGRYHTLPEVEQWEYACRAGTTTFWWTGDSKDLLLRSERLEAGVPQPVGTLAANPLGLCDMHGNVLEMVQTPDGVRSRGGMAGMPAMFGHSAWPGLTVRDTQATARLGFRVAVTGDLKASPSPAVDPPAHVTNILTSDEWEWTEPVNLGPKINSQEGDGSPWVSADGLTLLFASTRFGGLGNYDIWQCTRSSGEADWSEPANIGVPINSKGFEGGATMSADGCTLVLSSVRAGGQGNMDIWMSTRKSKNDRWENPVNLGAGFNSAANDTGPILSDDGLQLFFQSNRDGKFRCWMSKRPSVNDAWTKPELFFDGEGNRFQPLDSGKALLLSSPSTISLAVWNAAGKRWGTPEALAAPINDGNRNTLAFFCRSTNTLYFESDRPGGQGDADIWMSRRVKKTAKVAPPPDAKDPFVLLAGGNRAETRHPTLAAAVTAAASGDTIEIRGDGPFVCEATADAGTKALRIRAGDGFRPVLVGGNREAATLTSRGPLVLEGLDMRCDDAEGHATGNVNVVGQAARFTHCRFHAAGKQGNVYLAGVPEAEIQHSVIIAGKFGGLGGSGRQQGSVWSIRHSLITGYAACIDHAIDDHRGNYPRPLRVSMSHNTFVAVLRWLNMRALSSATLKAGQDLAVPPLTLELQDNLVAAPQFGLLQVPPGAAEPGREALEKFLKKQVRWAGEGNRLAGGDAGFGFHDGKDLGAVVEGLRGWEEWWGQESPFEIGEVRFRGGNMIARLAGFETPEPSEFRVEGGDGKKFGADMDAIGPGKPYHAWRKSPAYDEWQKKSDELLGRVAADKPPFAVLAEAGRAETHYATLADAVAAAQSGDTIEIRGDGPFPIRPLIIDRPLAIRAAPGSRPVLELDPADRDSDRSLFATKAGLVLEGLEVRGDSTHRSRRPLVQQVWGDDPLVFRNCRMVNAGGVVVHCASARLDIRNSVLIARTHTVVWLPPPVAGAVHVEQSVLFAMAPLGFHVWKDAPGALSLTVRDSTLVGSAWALALMWGLDGKSPPDPQRLSKVVVDPAGSVICGRKEFFQLGRLDDPPGTAELTDYLRRWHWKSADALVWAAGPLLWDGRAKTTIPEGKPYRLPDDWKTVWQADAVPLIGEPRFEGGDLLAMTPEQQAALPTDAFRLATGSPGKGKGAAGKDFGADVDLIGPGPAYERWRKTPEYQQWQARTKEFLAGK